jgi:hypothetical protein
MKVTVKGGGTVSLGKTDFVASGGEGDVYRKGGKAYKIYNDPKKMIPEAKFNELAAIQDQNVIRPQEILLDEKGKAVGYAMRFVTDTYTLCQLFPRAFREREGLDHSTILNLVRRMQESVKNIHRSQVLVVDMNEMNCLVSKRFDEAYFIDVDSYQTKHFPATAIMPSVRDWKTAIGDFSELSDWFSFAIISFQMFVGIHPYKGKHPQVKTLDERMQKGISVFNKDVGVPSAAYPVDVIPQVYRDWYRAVLEDGKRLAPPTDLQAKANIIAPTVRSAVSASLDVKVLFTMAAVIRGYHYSAHGDIVQTDDGVFSPNGQNYIGAIRPLVSVARTPIGQKPIVCWLQGDVVMIDDALARKGLKHSLRADEIMEYEGRVYLRNRDNILELVLTETNEVIVGTHVVASVMENSSHLWQGVVTQNMLGSTYISVFPRSKASYQVRIPELDGYKITDAKFDRGVLMVIGAKQGKYDRFVFRFDQDYLKYDIRVTNDITIPTINFVVLDSGVCVSMVEDEKLELFSSKIGSAQMKVVEDKALSDDMKLTRIAGKLGYVRGLGVCTLTMK